MKIRIATFFILILCTLSKSLLADNLRCLGSDGGTPFSNITHDVLAKQTIVNSSGLVRDFVVHESLGQIVYRNVRNQIRVLHLDHLRDHFVNYFGGKLSRVSEDSRGRVLSAHSPHYLDTRYSIHWREFNFGKRVTQHLFSEKGDIFSLENIIHQKVGLLKSSRYFFTFSTFENGRPMRRQCFIPTGFGTQLTLAQGNLFPYLHFYTIKKGVLEEKVVVYRMAVNRVGAGTACPIEEMTQYPVANLGAIHAFYYLNLDNQDSYAFHLADSKRNLFLDKPGECAYYNFRGRTPIFISPKHALFASWKKGEGLGLHNLKDKTEVSLFKNVIQNELGSADLHISEDGKTLYSSLMTSHDQGGKLIVKTDLRNF